MPGLIKNTTGLYVIKQNGAFKIVAAFFLSQRKGER
jgi:hypothetical protein